jgi:hypothetical protein
MASGGGVRQRYNSDTEYDEGSLYSGGEDNDVLHSQAQLYARLHAESAALNARLRELTEELLHELKPYEAIDVGPSLVLAHVEKPSVRRPITQKVLKEAGMTDAMLKEVLELTAPLPVRTGHLKIMVKTAYDALRPPTKRSKTE